MSEDRITDYTSVFEELCPYYMSMGMSYHDFWYGVPYLVKAYYKCHELKMKQKNQEMWWQGVYFMKALECTVGSMFAKKGSKRPEYPKQPFDLFPKDDKEKEREAEKERQKAIASFKNLESAMKRKFNTSTEINK